MKRLLLYLSIVIFFSSLGYGVYKDIQFDIQCKGYLELAANANSIELAKSNLDKAIQYIEKNQLTSGNSALFIKSPSNNITFWYANLKACQKEVWEFSVKGGTTLEQTNLLMKLRESLLNNEVVIVPEFLSMYPYQKVTILMLYISAIFGILIGIILRIE